MPADVVVRALARPADAADDEAADEAADEAGVVAVEEDKGGVLFWPGGPTYTYRRMTPVVHHDTEGPSV